MKKLAVWQVSKESLFRLDEADLELEKHLESWISKDPDLLQNGLKIVGRQVQLEAGPLDLLAVDPQGRWVAIELKRGEVDRKTVGQVFDYASCVADLTGEELRAKVESYLATQNTTLEEVLEERGALSSLNPSERQLVLMIVGTGSAVGLERVVRYLAQRNNLPISVLLFHVFKSTSGQLFLAREITEQETTVTPSGTRSKATLSVASTMALARKHGTYHSLQKALDTAEDLGLHVRPYQTSIMFAPPNHGSRMLFTVWAKPQNGKIKAYVGIDPFTEFFPLQRRAVADLVGPEGWRTFTPKSFGQFLRGVKDLLQPIRQSAE